MFKKVNVCDGVKDDVLSVIFGKSCQNDCILCNDQFEGAGDKFKVKDMIQRTISSNATKIRITGCDPFLRPNELLSYVKGIRNSVDSITVVTCMPETMQANRSKKNRDRPTRSKIVNEILHTVDSIEVRLVSSRDTENSMRLRDVNYSQRISTLKSLAFDFGRKITVNYYDISSWHDVECDMDDLAQLVKDCGIKRVVIFDTLSRIEASWDAKLPSAYIHGCLIDVANLLPVKEVNVKLKRNCNKVKKSSKLTLKEHLKVMEKKIFGVNKSNQILLFEDGHFENI